MYQYKAVLRSNKKFITEGHTLADIEAGIKHYRRGQKHGEHTHGNDQIEIFHIKRNKVWGKRNAKAVLIKVV